MNFYFKKHILILILFLIIGISATTFFIYFFLKKENKDYVITKDSMCLKDNEIANYDIKIRENYYGDVVVIIEQDNKKRTINIDNIRTSYHPIELHRCGIYLIKEFNVDYKKAKFSPGFNWTLWKYDYSGESKKLLIIAEKIGDSEPNNYFSTDFRIDPNERFLVLQKGYFGREDYTLVIKDLKTLQDIFILPILEIEKKNPDIMGNVSFEGGGWSQDGRYFWANTHYGATTLGFIRIDTENWQVDLFKAPEGVLGGDVFNVNTGYITVHPNTPWIGISEQEKIEKEKRRKQGIGTELYIHNLINGERQFVASTDEPLWWFKPQWLSDAELQYELPDGERKVFRIN